MDDVGKEHNDSIRQLSQLLLERDCSHFLLGDFVRFKPDSDVSSDSFKWRLTIERCKNVIVPTCDLGMFEKCLILSLRDLGLSHMLDVLIIREVPPSIPTEVNADASDLFVIMRPELQPLVNEQLLFSESNYDLVHLMSSETQTEVDDVNNCLHVRGMESFGIHDAVKLWNYLKDSPKGKIPMLQNPPRHVLYTSGKGVLVAIVQGDLSLKNARAFDDIRWNATISGTAAHTKSFTMQARVTTTGDFVLDDQGDIPIYHWRSTIASTRRLTKKIFSIRGVTHVDVPAHLIVYQYSNATLYDDCPRREPHGNSKSGLISKSLTSEDISLVVELLQRGKSRKQVIAHLEPGVADHQIYHVAAKNNLTKKYGTYNTDPDEIAKQVLTLSSEEFPVRVNHFVEVNKNNGKKKMAVAITIVNLEYLKHVLHCCPDSGEITALKERIKGLLKEPGGLALATEELRQSADESGIDKDWGGHLMYDTTFNLSGFWISFMLCDSTYFVNQESGKRHRNVVAWMLHNSKSEQTHQALFKHLNEESHRLKPKKRFTSFTTDAEAAFEGLKKNEIFNEGTHVLCDLHFLGNISSDSNRQGELKRILFGYQEDGLFVPGVLLKQTSYRKIIEDIVNKKNDGVIREEEARKLLKNKNLLRHGLVSRLFIRHSLGFLTTNSIEGFNANIKRSIGSYRRGVAQLAKESLGYVKSEMGFLRRAAAGELNPYVRLKYPVDPGNTSAQMKNHYDHICFYAFASKSNFGNPIDERLFMDLTEAKRRDLIDYCKKLKVRFLDDSQMEGNIEPIDNPRKILSKMIVDEQSLVCKCYPLSGKQCPSVFCVHIFVFFSSMTNPMRDKIMDSTVSNTKIFANPIDQYSGTKGRKIPSATGVNNHSRAVHLGSVKEEIGNEEEDDEVNLKIPVPANVSSSSIKDLDISLHEEEEVQPQKVARTRKRNQRYDENTFSMEHQPQPTRKRFKMVKSPTQKNNNGKRPRKKAGTQVQPSDD